MNRRILNIVIGLLAIIGSASAQTLSVASVEATAGEQKTLTVKLSDASSATAMQFNLSLPANVTINESGCALGSAASNHTLRVSRMDNGNYLFVIFSMDFKKLVNGTLLTIPVVFANDATSGNGNLFTVRSSASDAVSHQNQNATFAVNVNTSDIKMLGDLNDDCSVSITDVVLIVDVIAGSITDAKKVKAADVNKDGSVTITDCVAAIDLIAAQTKGARMNRASQKLVSSDYISAFMKDNLLTVNLDNENHYTAFQMVVTMPEGMTLDKAVIDKLRGTDHQLTVRNLGNGQYLLAGFSMGNSELAGNSGRLLTIGTKGQTKGDIIISDIEFATAEAEAYRLVPISISSTATGIYQVENREWSQDDVIFDLQGRRVNQTTSGLYIMNGKLIIVK